MVLNLCPAVFALCAQVLKHINELYDAGLSAGAPGAIGLKGIADALGLGKQIRKPRKKIRCCLLLAGPDVAYVQLLVIG
jgi:hypothetical protein